MLPISQISSSLPQTGLIYEIGSGFGGLAGDLANSSVKRTVIGLDIDKDKIKSANNAMRLSNLEFKAANAVEYKFQTCQGVVMSDFLHHLNFVSQEKLLRKFKGKLSKYGVLIIKEIDLADGWRMIMSRMWDFLFYPEDKIYYRSQAAWLQLLEDLGFKVAVTREVPWFPGSTFLYICQKA